MIKLLVLDMAGTTIDEGGAVYEALRASVELDDLNAGGKVADEDLQTWMGVEKREAMRELTRIVSGNDATADDVERMYGRFRDHLTQAYAATPPSTFPGTAEMFATVRAAGIKVALSTGFAREIADPILDALGWSVGDGGNLDAVVCGDEVARGRPAPYMIFRAMELADVDSVDEVLVAGDTVVDLRAGVNSGAKIVVGVTTGKLDFADLAAERHTHLLASVADIASLLKLD